MRPKASVVFFNMKPTAIGENTEMKLEKLPLGILFAAALAGCTSDGDWWKRTAYETNQGYRLNQCANDPATPCPERESYDDYQKKREAVLKGEK